jgi:Rod binding domain-containing protein
VQAAHEFEAQLMKELLKPLTRIANADGEDRGSESGGPLSDFAAESLGEALSRQGGLGIANNILHALSCNEKNGEFSADAGTKAASFRNSDAFVLKESSQLSITSLRRIAHGDSK